MATDTTTTIARPYAKAVFEIALAEQALDNWSDVLFILASISLDADVQTLIQKPGFPADELASIFIEVAGAKLSEGGKQFVKVLTDNKRLMVLPEIHATYEALKAEQEKSLEVSVISFASMSDKQKQALSESLKSRLQREITINETVDPSILGGAIIRAGDLVIDGSVKGKLEKLKTEIAA